MDMEKLFERTLELALALGALGLEVDVIPGDEAYGPDAAQDAVPGRIDPALWCRVVFSGGDLAPVHEAEARLAGGGILFDTGGWKGTREWELDWSFQVAAVPA